MCFTNNLRLMDNQITGLPQAENVKQGHHQLTLRRLSGCCSMKLQLSSYHVKRNIVMQSETDPRIYAKLFLK